MEAPGGPDLCPPTVRSIEITSIRKREDVISTLQYLNLINYYKSGEAGRGDSCVQGSRVQARLS